MKNIIVVANEDLKSFGRELVHAISKTKIAQASLFTPKQYADNEHQIGGTQYVIFLGKNDVSKDFVPLIQKKYEKHGITWGYDASKAVIYLESSNVELEVLEREVNQIKEEIKKRTVSPKGSVLTVTTGIIIANNLALSRLFLFPWYEMYYLIRRIIDHRKKLKETIKLQFKLGIISFLKDGFDDFVKVDLK